MRAGIERCSAEPLIKKLCILLVLLIFLPFRTIAVKPIAPQSRNSPPISAFSPDEVRSFVYQKARAGGVNPAYAVFIVSKESQFGRNMIGDDGKSVGYWQFNLQANPEISRSCAMDLKCSTDLALNWILKGKIMEWSTFRFCRKWYLDCPL